MASRSATLSTVTSIATGLADVQVAVDAATVERHAVHEKAEAQMVAGQRRHVLAETVAGPQPSQDAPGEVGPGLVVAMKVTRPSGVMSRVWGLAMSCRSAPKRSAWPPSQVVGERSGQEIATALGSRAPKTGSGSASSAIVSANTARVCS